MATVLALPWGEKLQQEQAEHSAAPQERRLFAAAGLVIYLHFPEAKLVALPLSSAVVPACEGHTVTGNNLTFS